MDVGPLSDGPKGVEPEGEAGAVGVPFAVGADIVGVPDEDESFIIVNWGLALPESPKTMDRSHKIDQSRKVCALTDDDVVVASWDVRYRDLRLSIGVINVRSQG